MAAPAQPRITLPARLEGEGVALRPLIEADVEPYAAAFAEDPELGASLGLETDPLAADVRDMAAGASDAAASGRSVALSVVTPPDDTFVGELFVHDIAWEHRRCDIGLWVTPGARRRGLAQAAVRRLLKWLFEELGMERAEMTTTTGNVAMRRTAARLGFAQEGILRAHNLERGRPMDLVLFGLVRENGPLG